MSLVNEIESQIHMINYHQIIGNPIAIPWQLFSYGVTQDSHDGIRTHLADRGRFR